jgi:hypothetical protein
MSADETITLYRPVGPDELDVRDLSYISHDRSGS